MGKSKIKIVLYLSAIFLVGGVVGGLISNKFVKPPFRRGPMTTERMTDWQMRRMVNDLELTSDQEERIRPIIKDISDKIREAGRKSFTVLTKLHEESYKSVSAELTPEQRVKMKEMRDRQRNRAKRFMDRDRRHLRPRGDLPPPPPEMLPPE